MKGRNGLIYELGRSIMPPSEEKIYTLLNIQKEDSSLIQKLHTQASLEKVILLVHRNAELFNQRKEHPILQQLIQQLQEEVNRRTNFTNNIIPRVRSQVTAALKTAELDFLFIKGSSLNGYPDGYVRQMNDLDMMFKNWDDLFSAAKILLQQNWRVVEVGEEAPWIMDASPPEKVNRKISAHINLVMEEGDIEITLDFHTSPFQVCQTGVLYSQIWQRRTKESPYVPAFEDKLLILVAHAVNHGYFLLKDFSDAYAILAESQSEFNWDYFCTSVEQSVLSYAALYLIAEVRTLYGAQFIPQWVTDSLSNRHRLLTKAIRFTSETNKKWGNWAETAIYLLHTYSYERTKFGTRSSIRQVMFFLSWRIRFFLLQSRIGNNEIMQRLLHSTRGLIIPILLRGRQILILPVDAVCEEIGSDEIEDCLNISLKTLQKILTEKSDWVVVSVESTGLFVCAKGAEIVLTPIGWYIPTIDGVFSSGEVEALENIVEELIHTCKTSGID